MKGNLFLYSTVLLLNCFLTSCLDIDDVLEERVNNRYQYYWDQVIGRVNPEHTWSMATNVTAHIQLSNQVSGQETVKIYTKAITNSQSRLLAEKVISNNESISFDILKGSTEVFVRVEDENGNISINDYFPIDSNNEVFVDNKLQGRNASTCNVTKGEPIIIDNKNFYYLVGNNTIKDNKAQWKIGDYSNLFAYYGIDDEKNGLFAEKLNNRDRWQNYIDMEKGVVYNTKEETEISLTYLFGAGWNWNEVGYYYYFEGENPDNADRYILIEDGRPQSNLTWISLAIENTDVKIYDKNNGVTGSKPVVNTKDDPFEEPEAGMRVGRMILGNMYNYSDHAESVVQGTEYKLVYFDKEGNASYTFPKDCRIGIFFFSVWHNDYNSATAQKKHSLNVSDLWYSTPSDSRAIHKNDNKNKDYTSDKKQTHLCVTYKFGGTTILGIEDKPRPTTFSNPAGYDYDMNDMLFKVTGNLNLHGNPPIEIYTIDPEEYSWIVACEDLGSTFDLDFNDVVFRLNYSKTQDSLVITPLAAGGTLPVYLYYDNQHIGNAEFHTLIDENQPIDGKYTVLCADKKRNEENTKKIKIGIPTEFSIANTKFIEKFSVRVDSKNSSASYFINNNDAKEGKAPQMLFLPGDWRWPKEQKHITEAYTGFKNWTKDLSVLDWMNNPKEELVVDDAE